MGNNIWRITLDTNPEDCNLNCIMCEEHSEFSNFKETLFKETGLRHRRMIKDMINRIMEEAHLMGVKEVIPTTMGDPLVSDSFDLIASLAAKHNIKLNVTHNGTFPRKSLVEWAKIIVPITIDIKISFNGATKETSEKIMRGLDFNSKINYLKDFIKYRDEWYSKTGVYCRVTFQMTFMKNNMHEIIDIIKLADEIGVDRIKGHHLWVHFPEIEHLSFYHNNESIKEWNSISANVHEFLNQFQAGKNKKLLLENFNPISENSIKQEEKLKDCPFLGKELWVSATGVISPCCAPDNLRQKLGYFGSFPENRLCDVTKSETYQYLANNYKEHKICKQCVMRK